MTEENDLKRELLNMFISKGKVKISGTRPNRFDFPFSKKYSPEELMVGIDILFENAFMVQVEENSPWWKITDMGRFFLDHPNDYTAKSGTSMLC